MKNKIIDVWIIKANQKVSKKKREEKQNKWKRIFKKHILSEEENQPADSFKNQWSVSATRKQVNKIK